MRTTLFPMAALLAVFLCTPSSAAEVSSTITEGQQALAQGDAETARRVWEAAAVRNEQAVYPLLVRLYEEGSEKDLAEAFKWAWIGLARTWDPVLQKDANRDFDRLQDTALRYQRQEGRARADQWLEANPLPTVQP